MQRVFYPESAFALPKIPGAQIKGLAKPVSRIFLGTHTQKDPSAFELYDAFYERGGNAFDSAHNYGEESSRTLGAWVNSRNVREKTVLIAKGAHTPDCFPQNIRRDLDIQLDWLGTPYADLYMMHRDNPDVPVGEFVDAMNEQVREGRIRVFGGSNWTLDRVAEANAYARKKNVQGFGVLSNNLALAEMVNPVWPGCVHNHSTADRERIRELGVTFLPWSSQARGFFMYDLAPGPDIVKDPWLADCWYSRENFLRRDRANELGRKHGLETVNIALGWVLGQKFPCFPIVGPVNVWELKTCLQIFAFKLSDGDLLELNLGHL